MSCQFTDPTHHGPCQTCRHRTGKLCGLTREALPDTGGCCHYNIALIEDLISIDQAMLALLMTSGANLIEILEDYDVPYHVNAVSQEVIVDPAEVIVPETYGLGTDPYPPSENYEEYSSSEAWTW